MSRSHRNSSGRDIAAAMAGWHFHPGQVTVRMIKGHDGKPKIQLRLDLGLLQMELSGRPDGKRPHNCRTELDHHRRRLDRHRKKSGSERGFTLSPSACAALRAEAALFYHRYLSLFVLEQFNAVIRDTQHNLDVLDICRRHALHERDRSVLEVFRPYLLMMQGRARACQAIQDGYPKTALAYLTGSLKHVLTIYPRPNGRRSYEAQVLAGMIRQVRRQLPVDPLDRLRRQIRRAVAAELYEKAADLRDELIALQTVGAGSSAEAVHNQQPAGRATGDARRK